LQQRTFPLTAAAVSQTVFVSTPVPQWAFCHTRAVKSRTFVHGQQKTPISLISGI